MGIVNPDLEFQIHLLWVFYFRRNRKEKWNKFLKKSLVFEQTFNFDKIAIIRYLLVDRQILYLAFWIAMIAILRWKSSLELQDYYQLIKVGS